jgi:hypothetical protein
VGTLPATGSAISFGRVQAAYTNGSYPRSAGENVALGAVLNTYISRGITETRFSQVFGGRTTPQNYP